MSPDIFTKFLQFFIHIYSEIYRGISLENCSENTSRNPSVGFSESLPNISQETHSGCASEIFPMIPSRIHSSFNLFGKFLQVYFSEISPGIPLETSLRISPEISLNSFFPNLLPKFVHYIFHYLLPLKKYWWAEFFTVLSSENHLDICSSISPGFLQFFKDSFRNRSTN